MKAVIKMLTSTFSALSIRWRKNDGFGLNELLGICAALILASFIVIPGLRTFASGVMGSLSDWWDNTVTAELFPNS